MLLPGEDPENIARAAAVLTAGGLVGFPTETVYGLGADARNPSAVARIYAAKQRPVGHPVIVHLAHAGWLELWTRQVTEAARVLAARFWPGPLTLILPRAAHVPDIVTGGQDSVGLRVPAHPVAAALLARFGAGIAAPSANRHGRVSPTTAAHVAAELGAAVDILLDGGPCPIGLESTIVDLTGARPRLLRPGSISRDALADALGTLPEAPDAASPRAPGMLASHYAPATPVELVPAGALLPRLRIDATGSRQLAVLARRACPADVEVACWRALPAAAPDYARVLYACLREADASGAARIIVEHPPTEPEWTAVWDRLRRAAAPETVPGSPGP